MSIRIGDGKGKNGDVGVSHDQRLEVSAKQSNRIYYVSKDDEQAYNIVMDGYSATAGDYVLYIKNTSTTKNLFINFIDVSAVNASLFKVWEVTGTAASAATITPANLNLSSGLVAEATCLGGSASVTGITLGKQIAHGRVAANGDKEIKFDDSLILTPNKAIVVEYDTGTTGICEVEVFSHFEDLA